MAGFDEDVLADAQAVLRADREGRLLSAARSGAQVRRAIDLAGEFALDSVRGTAVRAVLVATDDAADGSALVAPVIGELAADHAPVVPWSAAVLPRWAGASDALLASSTTGDNPRLVSLVDQACRRGLAVAVAAPEHSPLGEAARAGRAAFAGTGTATASYPVPSRADTSLPVRANVWAVLTPMLQAASAVGVLDPGTDDLLGQVADALDNAAQLCRPDADIITNPGKAVAIACAPCAIAVAGAAGLAAVAAHWIAGSVTVQTARPARGVTLPADRVVLEAMLEGPRPPAAQDFFADRVDEADVMLHLVVVGELDPFLIELAHRGAVGVTHLPVAEGPPLAAFASAVAVGEFAISYLAIGSGQGGRDDEDARNR